MNGACARALPGHRRRGRWSALALAAGMVLSGACAAAQGLSFNESARLITQPGDEPAESSPADAPVVLALAVSADGSLLALAGEAPAIALRDAATNRTRATLAGHSEPVTCLAFSPDGKLLASGGFDRTVRLWDLGALAERTALPQHSGWVHAVAFSPDGKLLAAGGQDKAVTLWDVADGRKVATLTGHAGAVRALAFAPDGATLASAGADRAVRLWNVGAGTLKATWDGHRGAVRALAFSPDGLMLASAGEDHAVRLWDVATGRTRATLADSMDMVLALAFAPRGDGLVAGAYDGKVLNWSPPHGKSVAALPAHREGVTALAFNPATGALVTAGYDRAVKRWSQGARIATLKTSLTRAPTRNTEAIFAPDGKTLITSEFASAEAGSVVRAWDTATWRQRGTLGEGDGATIFAKISADSRLIVTGTIRAIRVWDARRLSPIAVLESGRRGALPFNVAPDGSTVACIDENVAVALYDVPPGGALKLRRTLIPPDTSLNVQQLDFAPDGKTLGVTLVAPGEPRAMVSLRDVGDGREITRLTVRGRNFARFAFAPDGKTLAGAFSNAQDEGDTTLIFWSTATWYELARMTVPSSVPTTLTYSPDGARVALASRQGTVYFWNARTRRPAGQFTAHEGAIIVSLSFSPDSRLLATASTVAGEPVKIWALGGGTSQRTGQGASGPP